VPIGEKAGALRSQPHSKPWCAVGTTVWMSPNSRTTRSALALLLVAPILTACSAAGQRLHATATPDPITLVQQIRDEFIPAEGSPTGYGPTFSLEGYQTLLAWNEALEPEADWAHRYEALDIRLPCCGAQHPFADESKNCGCGHHQALYGAAKYLLRSHFSLEETQDEVDRWKSYFFPRETLAAVLEQQALTDPRVREALEELAGQGGC